MQRASFQMFEQTLIDKYSTLGCLGNEDCVVYYASNLCASDCGTVVPRASLGNLDNNLQSYAQANCSPDCPNPPVPCPAPPMPRCVDGRCL